MLLALFCKAVFLGFAIAAPVGPIGLLCIRRTLHHGRLAGTLSGLGAATADAVFALIGAIGIGFIAELLLKYQVWLRIAGGGFLLYLGIHTLMTPPAEKPAPLKAGGYFNCFISTFFLTLSNPLTIFSFAAIFAGLGVLLGELHYTSIWTVVGGVFIGSCLWWLILCEGMVFFRKLVSPKAFLWINRLSGAMIALFGLLVWLDALYLSRK